MIATALQPDLDTVLAAFVESFPHAPTYEQLQPWLERYPDFVDDLTDYAITWGADEFFAASPTMPPFDEAVFARGLAIIQTVQDELARAPLTSLFTAAAQQERSLATRVRIGQGVLAKLDAHAVYPETIPDALIDAIAAAIDRGAEAVREYLQPETGQDAGSESFRSALTHDDTMTQREKDRWYDA